jgi:hypothetical protein
MKRCFACGISSPVKIAQFWRSRHILLLLHLMVVGSLSTVFTQTSASAQSIEGR